MGGALEQARRGGSRVQRERKNKAMSADSWTREYGDVKASCDELYELIRERNSMTAASASSTGGGAREQDVHKLSAQCRRKLTSLSNKINEEVDLHQHLLDDLDSSVDNTQSMMKFARRKLEQVSRKSGSCKYIMVMILLVVVLALVISMSHMLTS